MDNTYFVLRKMGGDDIHISKFHICTWDISSKEQYLEIGLEISNIDKKKRIGSLYIVAPWVKKDHTVISLHKELADEENASFIFNDGVKNIENPEKDFDNWKTIEFCSGRKIDIIDTTIEVADQIITIRPNEHVNSNTPQYIRLFIPLSRTTIAKPKRGISQKNKIYDIKVNEKRNLDEKTCAIIQEKKLDYCKIESAYFLHVIPAKSEMVFSSNYSIKLRCLENSSFIKYLGKHASIKKKDYFITFNKLKGNDSYSSFCEFREEIIGTTQIIIAILVNILCSIIWAVLGIFGVV